MRINESVRRGLTPNFLEVVFNKNKLFLLKAPYSDDLYTEYKHNPNFFIHRFSGGFLYLWELRPTNDPVPSTFQEAEVTIEEHAPIFAKIVERAIETFFTLQNYRISKRRYSSIWEVELKQEQEGKFGALVLRPTLAFSVRNLYSKLENKQVIALTIRRRGKPIFIGDEDAIKNQLTDTRGLTQNHSGEIIASSHNVSRFLEATGQQKDYTDYLDEIESRRNEFAYLKKSPANFKKIAPKFHLPNDLKIEDLLLFNLPSDSFEFSQIPKPKYFYYNERTKTGYYNKVVSELRPYSFDLFRNQKLRILVVSPDEYEGSIGEYIVTLQKKLKELFHLNNIEFHLELVKSSEDYLQVLDKIDAKDYNLAIILLSQRDKEIDTPQSPYYLTKAKLLNQRLPTQDLTIEVLRRSNWIIDNNIALNV